MCPYYAAGDYYTGDYYEGDVFGFLKRTVTGAVRGFAKGGPLGAVGGAVAAATGRKPPLATPTIHRPTTPAIGTALVPGGRQGIDVPRGMGVPEPGMAGAVQRFLPFGQSGYGAAPPGYHVNKSYLKYLRASDLGRPVQNPFDQPRAVNLIVRNRRMNPLNPRALRHSVRRQASMVAVMRRALRGSGLTIKRSGAGGGKRRGPRRKT